MPARPDEPTHESHVVTMTLPKRKPGEPQEAVVSFDPELKVNELQRLRDLAFAGSLGRVTLHHASNEEFDLSAHKELVPPDDVKVLKHARYIIDTCLADEFASQHYNPRHAA